MKKIRVAFIKFGGLAAGGTERWLQMMAANLPRDQFAVDYFYCDAAPYVGSTYQAANTDADRMRYMERAGVNLIRFTVGAKDITQPAHDWVDTDFWQRFDPREYDLVQTGKCMREYPFHLLDLPVIEFRSLVGTVDASPNLAWSIHLSQYQRRLWLRAGGTLAASSVIPIPVLEPASVENLRPALNIPADALVAGFHQRADPHIASPIPLQAFARVQTPDRHFVILGGGEPYRAQAAHLNLPNVHVLPHSGDAAQISRFLNTLDIFAHGRRDGETFGTVLAEALMHGLPCLSHPSLVNANNAQPETMGPAGLFARDLADYTEKLDALFRDASLRARLAAQAQPHARTYYALPACVAALTQVYQRVLGMPATSDVPRPVPYGYSPLGFLQAGDLENRASIAHHLLTGEIPEEFDVHITRFFLPHVETFLDVGANIGLYCLLAANECLPAARIHAFEPQPDCCAFLRQSVQLNNWNERLCVHALGLGDAPGELPLHLSGTGSTFDNAFNDAADLPTLTVPVDTLDHQVARLDLRRVDFIKIDVEGFEQAVLCGAAQTIERDHPILFIEIAGKIRGRQYRNPHYAATLEWLAARGYRVWRCTETGKLELADATRLPDHLAMYLCLHHPKHANWFAPLQRWVREYGRRKWRERVTLWQRRLRQAMQDPRWAIHAVTKRMRARITHPSPRRH